MHRLTVLYGHPTNPDEFDRYYQETHIPIAKKMKGLKGWTIGKCKPAKPGTEAPYYMIVGLHTETADQMQAVLPPESLVERYSPDFFLRFTVRQHQHASTRHGHQFIENTHHNRPLAATRRLDST